MLKAVGMPHCTLVACAPGLNVLNAAPRTWQAVFSSFRCTSLFPWGFGHMLYAIKRMRIVADGVF